MPNILLEVTVESTPDNIYKAITEQKGLSSWWTTSSKAEAKEGTTSEFNFPGGFVIKMKVDKLDSANHKVKWTAVQGAPDWGGTYVTWELTPVDNGTKVVLGHHNYGSYDGSFGAVAYNWASFLTSLKQYVETGKGMPVPMA